MTTFSEKAEPSSSRAISLGASTVDDLTAEAQELDMGYRPHSMATLNLLKCLLAPKGGSVPASPSPG